MASSRPKLQLLLRPRMSSCSAGAHNVPPLETDMLGHTHTLGSMGSKGIQ